MKTKQELHCHSCNNYVQFDIDLELEGAHILDCPKCGHKHFRIVKGGVITDERWGQDPSQLQGTMAVYQITSTTYSSTSTYTTYSNNSGTNGTGNYMLYQSWANTTTAC